MAMGSLARAGLAGMALALCAGCNFLGFGWDNRGGKASALRDRMVEMGPTPIDAMPTGGSASFNGLMNAWIDGDDKLYGDVHMVADFNNDRVTGTISDVTKVDGILIDDLSGTIALGASSSYISGNTFQTSITGTLADNGPTISYNWVFSANASGQFYGETAPDGAVATISGSVWDTFIWPSRHDLTGYIVVD